VLRDTLDAARSGDDESLTFNGVIGRNIVQTPAYPTQRQQQNNTKKDTDLKFLPLASAVGTPKMVDFDFEE
jgi:hypothetical protein